MKSGSGQLGAPPLVLRLDTLVSALLFISVAMSFLVIVEPAPYELFVFALGGALLFTRTRVQPLLGLMLVLVILWLAGGAFALMPVMSSSDAVTYYGVSAYMGVTALIFALALSEHTAARFATLKNAYVLAALIAAGLGILGYFVGIERFVQNGRATSTFKDPNVFGPFLILPCLLLIQDFLYRGFRLGSSLLALIMLLGLMLSFSRGAWGHFIASTLVMVALMFWTNKNLAFRLRLIRLSALSGIGIAAMVALLLSFSSVGEMFSERANLVNYYDTGEQGRFGTQFKGFMAIFDYPNGLGPHQYAATFGIDPHNVYLASLYAYGWVGGFAYFTLAVTTLVLGFKGLLVRAPWQPALIAVYATYLGVALEGFIIDTDHWRHYFLLMGAVWGLAVASLRQPRVPPKAPPARCPPRRLEDRARIAQP
ncbi:MAG: hypothetical protein K0R27_1753 [Xanthobacteraceae bacterium]|jgi:hypothetical protein|nr:hypothetical protein [Xanthobacteraceae bacterium]